MSANELTGTEVAALMVLMAEARTVRNPEFKELASDLKKPSRDKLVRMGAVEVGKEGRTMTLELTDKGWKMCHDLMGSQPPPQASKALFTVLAGLRRWLDREDRRPAEVFFPRDTPATIEPIPTPANAVVTPAVREQVPRTPAEVEARVRAAYADLAREPGAYLRLSRLRPALDGIPRADQDSALVLLQRQRGVNLIPEENQKTLTDEDRAAAVLVGNQHNHLLAIHS